MGSRAKGAILAMIETFRDTTSLEWYGGPFNRTPTSPANESAEALGKIGRPAVEPLIAALKDRNSDVRRYAAWALGEIGDARVVVPLIGALKDEDPWVREEATGALWLITEPYFGEEDPEKWSKWWEQNKESFLKGK